LIITSSPDRGPQAQRRGTALKGQENCRQRISTYRDRYGIPAVSDFRRRENSPLTPARSIEFHGADQIVARLWSDDSFLDTERSINTAVRKALQVLRRIELATN
jgi:hypothetical protein